MAEPTVGEHQRLGTKNVRHALAPMIRRCGLHATTERSSTGVFHEEEISDVIGNVQ